MKQVLTVLGATGSIGVNTLDVVARHPDRFEVFALAGHRQTDKLAEQCRQFAPKFAVVADEAAAVQLRQQLDLSGSRTEVLSGPQALIDVAAAPEVSTVMAAIVGAAGLLPTWAAAQAGKKILLANKETLVVAGALFMQAAQAGGATVLPVDSEHNAIFQVLPQPFSGSLNDHGIESLILTASGGPFLQTDLAQLAHITPEQAVKHPNWSMGQKISVDSATMMNKGLELIEAHWLFHAPAERLEVVIHPQSVIHSMVRYRDGSVLAQLGTPDMRTPIAYCLGLPERLSAGVAPLDFSALSELTFRQPETARFPCLQLAYQAMHSGGDTPCVLNAANEIAVAAFLQRQIGFTDIAAIVAECLSAADIRASGSLNDLLAKDAQVRALAVAHVANRSIV